MAIDRRMDRLREETLAGKLSRRDVVRRSIGLGLSAPVIASLLAACGGDGDGDTGEEETEAPSGQGDATETEAATETETEEAAETAGETATEGATGTEGAPAGERGGMGKVLLLYWQAPTILNMHLAQGTKDFHAARICQEPLVTFDSDTNPILVLAEEWPSVENGLLAEDGTWVTWKLRQGVKWHDGEEFTAEDVAFTVEYCQNEATTATTIASYLNIESTEVIDDYTVKLNFIEPMPNWFDPFNGLVVLPQHILKDNVGEAARDAEFNLSPIGTGPFKVTQFSPGDVALYEIFEDYWDPGKPHLDEIELKGGGDAVSAARAVIVTGEADWAWNLQVEPAIIDEMEQSEDPQGELVVVPGTSAERIYINFANPNVEVNGAFSEPTTEHPIWKHKEAREALNLAIPRERISEELYGPLGQPSGDNLNVPERFKLNWPWEYNLDKAREKLAVINFPDDFESTDILYQTSSNTVRQKTQQIVKEVLEQLGFTVTLKAIDSAVFFSSDAGNPDTYSHFYADIEMYTNGPGSPYPIDWATRYRSDRIAQKANAWALNNITRYNNPEYDELHNQAQVEIDESKQNEIWEQMLTIVYEDIVEVPEVWRAGGAAVHNRIKNWSTSTWASTPPYDLKNWTTDEPR